MTSKSVTGFPKRLREALSDGKTEYATKLFNLERNSKEILNNSWDIIPVLTENLNRNVQNDYNEVFNCSKQLLSIISDRSNSQEALLQLIAEIEEAKDDVNFVTLLDPIFKVLLRIPDKKVNSLAWSFNAIQSYLEKCETPDYEDLDGKERLLGDNSETAWRIFRLYHEVIVFYENVLTKFNNFESEARSVVSKFLIQLLGKPLCLLSMEQFGRIKTQARECAETIVDMIFKIMSDPFVLVEMKLEGYNDELTVPNSLGLANLFYLIYCEGVHFHAVPKIYNPIYVFQVSLHLLYTLIDEQNLILSEKGLMLSEYVLVRVKNRQLSYLMLGSNDHRHFCTALSNLIVYHPSKTIRVRALNVLNCYLQVFSVRGVYLIVFNLMDILTHSGLIGYLITFYKDLLNKAFLEDRDRLSEYFKGPKLFRLLRKFCQLKEKEETDLMDNSDQIISALNLVRYLVLRDSENLTQIWDFLPTIQCIFLEPLQKAIDLSRAHYQLRIEEFHEEKRLNNKKESIEMSVTVKGSSLPQMDNDEKIKVLNSSLTVFDVMQSILTRVMECIRNKS